MAASRFFRRPVKPMRTQIAMFSIKSCLDEAKVCFLFLLFMFREIWIFQIFHYYFAGSSHSPREECLATISQLPHSETFGSCIPFASNCLFLFRLQSNGKWVTKLYLLLLTVQTINIKAENILMLVLHTKHPYQFDLINKLMLDQQNFAYVFFFFLPNCGLFLCKTVKMYELWSADGWKAMTLVNQP